MKVLHAYNAPRSGGGSLAATRMTIAELRRRGLTVEEFVRDSALIPPTIAGRIATAHAGLTGGTAPAQFARALDRFAPDLVHINELFPLITPRILPLCTARRIPVVMSVDDFHLTCPARTHFRSGAVCDECLGGRELNAIRHNCKSNLAESAVAALYNRGFRLRNDYPAHVAHFVTPAPFVRDWIVRNVPLPAHRVSVIHLPVDIPPDAADPTAGRYAAFAGRMVPEKGIDLFVRAIEKLKIPARFARAANFFQTVELPAWAELVIPADRAELAQFYRGARLLAMPSRWFETFGLVGAEAMSHGIPIVVPRLGAVGQLVEHGVQGLTFEANNADDLAEQIHHLWTNDDDCRRMGADARRRAAGEWSLERHGELMLRLYENVLAASTPAAPDA